MGNTIRAVLWDADGVLQHARRGWYERLTELGGAGFAEALFAAEGRPLRGTEPFGDVIARLLSEWRLDLDPDVVLALWEDITLDTEAFDLIAALRRAGTRCYLATNQQDYRVRFMRRIGYDDHFDGTYYSSEVGAVKPEEAYFQHVLTDLGIPAAEVLFIDDSTENVAAAAALGIQAAQHDPPAGVAGLRRILAEAGVLA